jgi:hypothetical protein
LRSWNVTGQDVLAPAGKVVVVDDVLLVELVEVVVVVAVVVVVPHVAQPRLVGDRRRSAGIDGWTPASRRDRR